MAVATAPSPAFELKDARLPLVVFALATADVARLAQELASRLAETPQFFDNDPVILELGALADHHDGLDCAGLLSVLHAHRIRPVLASGGTPAQMAAALAAGLPAAPAALQPARARTVEVIKEVEITREVPVYQPPLIIDRPLRSGQQVYAKGCDLIVLAVVNPGAEVIADGSIHVYAPLRGRAIAGSRGNTEARILSTCLEPELVSIAVIYRPTETALAPEVAGKPAQVRLVGDKLVLEALRL